MVRATKTTPRRTGRADVLAAKNVLALVDRTFGDDLHAKTVLSLAMGVVGVLHAASLGIHAIGRGLAAAKGTPEVLRERGRSSGIIMQMKPQVGLPSGLRLVRCTVPWGRNDD